MSRSISQHFSDPDIGFNVQNDTDVIYSFQRFLKTVMIFCDLFIYFGRSIPLQVTFDNVLLLDNNGFTFVSLCIVPYFWLPDGLHKAVSIVGQVLPKKSE